MRDRVYDCSVGQLTRGCSRSIEGIERVKDVLVFRSQSANRIDELYYIGMRLSRDAAARRQTEDWVTKSPVRHKLYRVLLTILDQSFLSIPCV
jgi:hypothetical protein